MIESRTLLQIFESKLEETARLFFTNSFITVDLVTLIYNIVFWGLAIPAVIYLLRVEKIEKCLSSLFLVFSKANSDSHKCLGVTFFVAKFLIRLRQSIETFCHPVSHKFIFLNSFCS